MDPQVTYAEFARNLMEHVMKVVEAKNHDYAGEGSDPLWNFDMAAAVTRRPTAEVIVSRMADKLSRLANAAKHGLKVGETPEQTVEDMIGYSILAAWAMRERPWGEGGQPEKEPDGSWWARTVADVAASIPVDWFGGTPFADADPDQARCNARIVTFPDSHTERCVLREGHEEAHQIEDGRYFG